MNRESFVLYCSQLNALSELNDAQLGRLIRYLVQFLQKGSLPSKRESNALLVAFNVLKLQISIDLEKYDKRKEKNKEYYKKNKIKKIKTDSACYNYNDNCNDNCNDNDNGNNIIDSFSFSLPEQEEKQEEKRRKFLQSLKDWWNNAIDKTGSNVPKVQRMTAQRAQAFLQIKQKYTSEEITKVLKSVCQSDYMNGRTREKRLATFDFVFQEDNFLKILEGVYR